ncbi:MAG: MerR family DNA-binding transcriptional regulator [Parcubacteria group bacterium]|nr:MerR family DNA-binding transcriptional regulator [Parcubacteria group bacterium]MCR4342459.1 MerR family DNA-binding transcriptional regulator [Patescibacteria group bacterium]
MKRRMGIKYLTIKEASLLLGVSPQTLRIWDEIGKFEAKRDSKNNYRIYRIPEIESFIKKNNFKISTNKRLIIDE